MARSLHADACRNHALVAWIVLWDLPAYPKRFAARLATNDPSPYLLLANTLVCTGLLLPGERKSIEPMAARLDPGHVQAKHQSLHHVVAQIETPALPTGFRPRGAAGAA